MSVEYFLTENSWKNILKDVFSKSYFQDIDQFLDKEYALDKSIYPPINSIFRAFNITPFYKVKVVIIGQDPYHKVNQAMGLSFSVPKEENIPPSLRNIFKELNTDLNVAKPTFGDLTSWAEQGVFLLNAILTVEAGRAGSHKNIGWQQFTNAVIEKLSDQRENLVFMLWGNFAKSKKKFIDGQKHLILEAAHPSPLARGAYFGSKHFSKCNEYLLNHHKEIIKWNLN